MADRATRREFLQTAAAGAALFGTTLARAGDEENSPPAKRGPGGPLVIASANGLGAIQRAMTLLKQGSDPLDAVVAGVNLVEDDPNDMSVGLGGLPNEDGIVELDAAVMHGPTHKAGAVASLRNIRNPSRVALRVMQRTDHVLLVGEGALRFARAHGFVEENLLTDQARRLWLDWKERHSDNDNWLPPTTGAPATQPVLKPGDVPKPRARSDWRDALTYGTINCLALSAGGDLAGVTTTSGLSFKLAGRVGDSPIIGAGLYVDNAVGAAGSTGRGEANLLNCSSFSIVEMMRSGMDPGQACREQLKRVANHAERRLLEDDGHPKFGLTFYAITKDGRYGAAAMRARAESAFVVHDGQTAKRIPCPSLYETT